MLQLGYAVRGFVASTEPTISCKRFLPPFTWWQWPPVGRRHSESALFPPELVPRLRGINSVDTIVPVDKHVRFWETTTQLNTPSPAPRGQSGSNRVTFPAVQLLEQRTLQRNALAQFAKHLNSGEALQKRYFAAAIVCL